MPISDRVKPQPAGTNVRQFETVSNKMLGIDPNAKIPKYSSGARSFVRIGGKPIGVAQRVQWEITFSGTPIHTVDSVFPWDIDVGAARISAQLESIMDPFKGQESDRIGAIMSAAIHQPIVELQIVDMTGTCLFYSKGMFLSIKGNVPQNGVGTWNASFIGIAYQHFVGQQFKPYNGISSTIGKLLNDAKNFVSDLTGGIL